MYIFSPKSRKRLFLDNSISDYQDRLKKVEEVAFNDEILNYCHDNRMMWSKRQEQAYINAEHILENIATYLLMGMYKGANIMTLHKIRQQYQREIPESNTASNAVDLIYGADYGADVGQDSIQLNATTDMKRGTEVVKDITKMSAREIERNGRKQKQQIMKYKNSRPFRMEKLFSTRELETYRLIPVKEKDEDGKEKVVRNVFGQPIFIDERITIGGNKGLIDRSKDIGQWCTVNTDNEFIFMDKVFVIDKSVKQYRVGKDNQCQMDKILAYYLVDSKKFVFFDEGINQVKEVKCA